MKASIVIRTKNEERWIGACLDSVFQQSYPDYEVIIVDNQSEDGTLRKAESYDIKIVTIDDFRPGLAINDGVRASSGDFIVCLSGHCIAVDDTWLANLVAPLSGESVAGVYGRQQPMSFSSDRDKRDLLTVFGLDPKVQRKDPFFHNANSALRRDIWEEFPFDEKTKHIEDRLWAKEVLRAGMEIHYRPEASVYHYHGIHQDDDPLRRRRVVRILENLAAGDVDIDEDGSSHAAAPNPEDLHSLALIPVRGAPVYCGSRPLLSYTIEQALSSRFVDRAIVLTDNEEAARLAGQYGGEVPFLRPRELSKEFVSVTDVLKFAVDELRNWDIRPDLCIVLEETYPFRPKGFVDELIIQLLREGTDCVLAARPEKRSIWMERDDQLETMSPFIPRRLKKDSFLVSLFGLGFVTYPECIHDGSLGFDNPYTYCVEDALAAIEVRDAAQREKYGHLLEYWHATSRD